MHKIFANTSLQNKHRHVSLVSVLANIGYISDNVTCTLEVIY